MSTLIPSTVSNKLAVYGYIVLALGYLLLATSEAKKLLKTYSLMYEKFSKWYMKYIYT